jgi:hypothetical protein
VDVIRFLIVAGVGLCWPGPLLASGPQSHLVRLRPIEESMAVALRTGVLESQTFRDLVAKLECSDVIVHLGIADHPRGILGTLHFVSVGGPFRFLKVLISWKATPLQKIWVLGHEFQHAIEVAGASEVRSRRAFEAFYASPGFGVTSRRGFDTDAAREIGKRIRGELHVSRKSAVIYAERRATAPACQNDQVLVSPAAGRGR